MYIYEYLYKNKYLYIYKVFEAYAAVKISIESRDEQRREDFDMGQG